MNTEIVTLCFRLRKKMAVDHVNEVVYLLRHLFFRVEFVYRSLFSIQVVLGLSDHDRSFPSYCCLCSMPSIASDRERPDKELFREIGPIVWKPDISLPN